MKRSFIGYLLTITVWIYSGLTCPALAQEFDLEKVKNLNGQMIQLYHQGHFGDAIPLAKEVLAMWEKALGPEHPNVASSLNNLALIYSSAGDYRSAEPLFKRALAISEKTLGPEHPDVALSMNNLAELYRIFGGHVKAVQVYERVLTIKEKTLGPGHPGFR